MNKMKTLQEKQLEDELKTLIQNNSLIPTKTQRIKKDEYYITITITPTLLSASNIKIEKDIIFLLHIVHNYPFNPPKLYCLTTFSYPSLCDGRDILEEVINATWTNQYHIVEIINSIPKFILDFLQNLEQKKLRFCGKYYLDSKYDFEIVSRLPVYFEKVQEVYTINGNKEIKESRYLMISDLFFVLFDFDFFNKSTLRLVFWSTIKSLSFMREISGNCEFTWKIKGGRKFTMKIETLEGDKIINLLVDNLKKFGINYSISTKTLGPKEGVIPSIDIDIVESQIKEMEEKIKKEDTAEMVKFLMVLYEKAVQYYSAINNERYEVFTKKIKDMMAESRYRDVFEEKDNGNNDNKDKQDNKEEQKEEIKEESKKEDINKKIDFSKEEMLNNNEKKENIKIDNLNEITKEERKQEPRPDECKQEIKEEKKEEVIHEEKKEEFTKEEKKEEKPLLMNIIKDEEKKEDNKQKEEVKEESATTVKVSVKKEDLNFDFDDD